MPYDYDFIMSALDRLIDTFGDSNDNVVSKRVNSSGIVLNLRSEVQMLLDGLGVIQSYVEMFEVHGDPNYTYSALCISFYTNGKLGVYNIPVIDKS